MERIVLKENVENNSKHAGNNEESQVLQGYLGKEWVHRSRGTNVKVAMAYLKKAIDTGGI